MDGSLQRKNTMKALLSLAILITILFEPLLTDGSPLQLDNNRISSDHSYSTPATMEEIESVLGINEHKPRISYG